MAHTQTATTKTMPLFASPFTFPPAEHRRRYPYAVPAGKRVYAIGDIHGRIDLLLALHRAIRQDADSMLQNVVVYLGDYIDRGPRSREVIETLLRPLGNGFQQIFLKGNHEAAMLSFIEGNLPIGQDWMRFGGAETLASYGIAPPKTTRQLLEARDALHQFLPESHWEFLESCAMSHREGGFFFAHAGIRPNVPLEFQKSQDLMWIREEFLANDAEHGCIVVHGHTISNDVDWQHNRIGIDTGAIISDKLTALVIEGNECRLLQTAGRDAKFTLSGRNDWSR